MGLTDSDATKTTAKKEEDEVIEGQGLRCQGKDRVD